jgi:pentapeptide MXKDX repeat protein
MNKVSATLLSCCLAVSASFAFAGDGMSMSMEKSASGDAMMRKDGMAQQSMKKDAPMKKDAMAKTMMKKPGKGRHAMTHRKMHGGNKPDAMAHMQ